jgi:hypothetical protein
MKKAEAEPLRALIDEYLLKRDKSKQRYDGHHISMHLRPRPGGRLSPSSVYGCQRQAVMRFTGMRGRKTIDPDQELLFEDGNWRHHKWQYLFYDMEAVLGRNRFRVLSIEEFISIPDMYVAGSLDVLIAIKIDGKWRRYVIDIKGINDRGYSWITQTDAPKDDNVRQLLLYMKAKNVRRGILLYDNKNTNRPKTFTVDFNSEHWEQVKQWTEEVINSLQRGRMPSRHIDCRPGTMMHDGCIFRSMCWSSRYDTTDLQEIAYNPKTWPGMDAAWEAGLKEFSGA